MGTVDTTAANRKEYYTISEAAELLGLTIFAASMLIKRRGIEVIKDLRDSRKHLVEKCQIDAMLKNEGQSMETT